MCRWGPNADPLLIFFFLIFLKRCAAKLADYGSPYLVPTSCVVLSPRSHKRWYNWASVQVLASVSQQLRFHNTAASRRRAVVQIVPEPSTRPPAHVPMCARSAGSRWVPQSKRSLHCSARSHCGAAPRRRSMSGLQGQRFSAARGLRHGPGRPHGAPEAAGVASLMTCATRRRGQLRFHNAPHFWHPPASRA